MYRDVSVESTKQTLSLGPAGILNDDGTLNNDASCLRLAEVAVAYARAGEPLTSLYMLFFCVGLPLV